MGRSFFFRIAITAAIFSSLILGQPTRLQRGQIPRDDSTELKVVIQNNQSIPLYAYVTGIKPSQDDDYVLLVNQSNSFTWKAKPSGTWTNGSTEYFTEWPEWNSIYELQIQAGPNGNTSVTLPSYVNSARLYISSERLRFGTNLGTAADAFVAPSPSNWGLPEYSFAWQFIEFTYGKGNLIVNPSYVDFLSMNLGIGLTSTRGNTTTVPGLKENALDDICNVELPKQAKKDGYTWDKLCISGPDRKWVRAISPNQLLSINASDPMNDYYAGYVDAVWNKYSTMPLTINTQDSETGMRVEFGKNVSCQVDGSSNVLSCKDPAGPSYAFPKPSTAEIMGCAQKPGGTFEVDGSITQAEIVPRLCAAFTRSTLLLEGGELQPNVHIDESQYYTNETTNHYARLVHDYQQFGMGYAFAYDDTNPVVGTGVNNATTNAAGLISDSDPELLFVSIGT